MDSQYIVEFDCTTDSDDVDVFTSVLGYVAGWISGVESRVEPEELLAERGSRDFSILLPGGRQVAKKVTWRTLSTDSMNCVTGSIHQPLDGSATASFVATFTLLRTAAGTRLRLEMGRETHGVMRPATIETLRRPGILGKILRDRGIHLRRRGQLVDGDAARIQDAVAAEFVGTDILGIQNRLPVLVVDGRSRPAVKVGMQAARELAGLLQVVIVYAEAIDAMATQLRNFSLEMPFHGAILVWPDAPTVARHPRFTPADIEDGWRGADYRLGVNSLVSQLMRMLGPLSVVAAGSNQLLADATKAVNKARREAREAEFQRGLAAAAAAPNDQAALVETRQMLEASRQETADLVEYFDKREADLLAQIEQQQRDHARAIAEIFATPSADEAAAPADWDDLGEIDPTDLEPLAEALSQLADGAIIFTDNACAQWKDSNYPHHEKMRDQLIRLAQAAVAYRTAGGSVGERIDDWLKSTFELNSSRTDVPLRRRRLNSFVYDGMTYSREPHVKLDDHVSPNEVGRIYFALDNERMRFIVDHVGLKLYGLR